MKISCTDKIKEMATPEKTHLPSLYYKAPTIPGSYFGNWSWSEIEKGKKRREGGALQDSHSTPFLLITISSSAPIRRNQCLSTDCLNDDHARLNLLPPSSDTSPVILLETGFGSSGSGNAARVLRTTSSKVRSGSIGSLAYHSFMIATAWFIGFCKKKDSRSFSGTLRLSRT